MKKYLVLYHSEAALGGISVAEMFANTPAQQLAAGRAAWKDWHEKCESAVADLGAPLANSTIVVEGAGTPGKTTITGYTFLKAASMDQAVSLLKDHPHFHMPGASAQLLECISMPGM